MMYSTPKLVDIADTIRESVREALLERVAILEYEAGFRRPEAETRARQYTPYYRRLCEFGHDEEADKLLDLAAQYLTFRAPGG